MGAAELEQPGRRIRKGMSLAVSVDQQSSCPSGRVVLTRESAQEVEQVQEEQPVSDVQDYLNNLSQL